MSEINIIIDVKALNKQVANQNRVVFHENHTFVINIMGSPGSGKTTLLENILPALSAKHKVAVIEGDLATENDANRIRKLGVEATQIITDGACHLDAKMIQSEIRKLNLEDTEILIIENVGNLVCPISYDLGEEIRIVVLSIPEGEDKPLKYPNAILHTDVVILTKIDLAPYVSVDPMVMKKYINSINSRVAILEVGKVQGEYRANEVVSYIEEQLKAMKG